MFDNLTVLAVIIILIWVATFVYYFRMSRRQQELREELDALRAMLDDEEESEG